MITYRGRDFKSGQEFQIGAGRFQIGTRGISNRGRDYKSVQNNTHFFNAVLIGLSDMITILCRV